MVYGTLANQFMKHANASSFLKKRRNKFSKNYPRVNKYSNSLVRMVPKLANSVRFIKGLINSELHEFDVALSSAISTTWSISNLVAIDQGTGNNNRIGNKILAKAMFYRMTIVQNASAVATIVRYIFLQDTANPNGSLPSATDFIQNLADVNSPLSSTLSDRWIILRDNTVCLSNSGDKVFYEKRYLKINDHINYTGGTGNSSFDKGSIYLVRISNESTNTPTFAADTRLTYYDN